VGVNLSSIGVPVRWWLETARVLESAGFGAVWCADHFISRGRLADPVLECWTTLTATAAVTRALHVGSWVTNVMNRHPSLLARMAATVQELSGGRLELGIGIGGHPGEHRALGIPMPPVPERVARLEEAVNILRLLWSGGPVSFDGAFYQLREAYAFPIPQPAPRIIVGGESRGGARLAARVGDAWTTTEQGFERYRAAYEEGLQEYGRARGPIVVGLERAKGIPANRQSVFADLRGELERWRERGADEIVVSWVRPHEIPALLAAAARARLS
jgi:alkanesulfonate monooxygenase SsuD/methylene tetrahydromethanopterin reductase-like flavin-dependent oxidoreductase (luciferase family)